MRSGFGLPEVVESTAMSYLKRFYVKSSVMEWHPRIIMSVIHLTREGALLMYACLQADVHIPRCQDH